MTFRRYLLTSASPSVALMYDVATKWLERIHRLRTIRGGRLWP